MGSEMCIRDRFSHFSHFPQLPQYVNVVGERLETKTPAFYDCSMNFYLHIFLQKSLTDNRILIEYNQILIEHFRMPIKYK